MNYKIQGAFKRNRKYFAIFIILWLLLAIVFVAPLARTLVDASHSTDVMQTFLTEIFTNIANPIETLGRIFSDMYIDTFLSCFWKYTFLYIIVVMIGILRSAPKNQYYGREHGSSDWSENGEQYRILSPNKGIILAEKNYLPIDKRGNTNVLVVGRFWFW
ncbi:MAG: hypothetical protein ACLU8F_05195 [Clostridia bacterium]